MKIATINVIVGILGRLKINCITDKRVKSELINDYLRLRPFIKKAGEDSEALKEKFRADWAEEHKAVQKAVESNRPVVGHDKYLDAKLDNDRAIAALFSEEVEVDIKCVPMDDFMTSCGGEELTLEELAFLQEAGIVG